ncbi:unnamed protein product [Spirodela intermedia]|uniref:Uncharacterized protein n=1 Tax=Spirodela intermedia TaxID=51605 RepID=A0A7I8JPG3_SPIIN|nr:unnamed protein product [Spirodela intermedia]CAA2632916.1 unnamed protein product [Spirodela intermedia]CAA2632920.1 unnamed protein product [Spirodela intermedia]CAA6672064.1 unnamed protein product [Spirodela intermedia]CAA6672066.1 unnamed protein product [Spirodela intermedia]
MSTRHECFQSFVRSHWHGDISDSLKENLSYKLKNLKFHLKWWNRHVYGNIHTEVEELKKDLVGVERQLQARWTDDTWISTQVVRWRLPPVGHQKLNVNGTAQGNPGPTGGGGILWDHTGSIISAFSYFYNIQLTLQQRLWPYVTVYSSVRNAISKISS